MAKRTEQRRRARQRERLRNRLLAVVAVMIVLGIVLAVALFVINRPADAPIPENITERFADIEVGVNSEGFPRLGRADAPVQVVEFSSFSCPGCQEFHDAVFSSVLEQVREDNVAFTYVPLTTGSIPNAAGAARAALCAGEQGRFWEFHDILFEWQALFGNTAFNTNRLRSGAEALDLNIDQWNDCFNSGRITDILQAAQLEGVLATPTVTINGTTVDPVLGSVMSAINDALAFASGRGADDVDDEVGEDTLITETPPAATQEPAETTAEAATEEDVVDETATPQEADGDTQLTEEPDESGATPDPES